jgi:hypothetical protein
MSIEWIFVIFLFSIPFWSFIYVWAHIRRGNVKLSEQSIKRMIIKEDKKKFAMRCLYESRNPILLKDFDDMYIDFCRDRDNDEKRRIALDKYWNNNK